MGLREEGYWDKHYELELRNYQEDGDEGEVWFGKGLSRKIVSWIGNNLKQDCNRLSSSKINILDVGCGNAYLLYTLADKLKDLKETREVSLVGLDYAINSVELSRKIVADKDLSHRIMINQCNFLDRDQVSSLLNDNLNGFQYVIDKGTLDAICLLAGDSSESLLERKRKFMESLYSLVGDGSIFILASCNHTTDELKALFQMDCSNRFNSILIDTIETPKIQFGGKEGSQVSCIIVKFTH